MARGRRKREMQGKEWICTNSEAVRRPKKAALFHSPSQLLSKPTIPQSTDCQSAENLKFAGAHTTFACLECAEGPEHPEWLVTVGFTTGGSRKSTSIMEAFSQMSASARELSSKDGCSSHLYNSARLAIGPLQGQTRDH